MKIKVEDFYDDNDRHISTDVTLTAEQQIDITRLMGNDKVRFNLDAEGCIDLHYKLVANLEKKEPRYTLTGKNAPDGKGYTKGQMFVLFGAATLLVIALFFTT